MGCGSPAGPELGSWAEPQGGLQLLVALVTTREVRRQALELPRPGEWGDRGPSLEPEPARVSKVSSVPQEGQWGVPHGDFGSLRGKSASPRACLPPEAGLA